MRLGGHALGSEERVSEAKPSSSLLIPGFSVFPDFVVFSCLMERSRCQPYPRAEYVFDIRALVFSDVWLYCRLPHKYRFVYLGEDPAILLGKEDGRKGLL